MSNLISKAEKVKQVFQLIEEIKQAQSETVKGYLVIGRNLDIIQKENIWQYYGSHLENFEMFLTEIGFKHATAWNCIRIWRIFGTYKNLDVDYFRLVRLLPVVNEENKSEWIEKAKVLTPNDFNDEIRIAKGKVSQLDCKCPFEEQEFYTRCRICQKWKRREKDEFKKLLQIES